jgi:large subunit ribosomal protein L2
MAIKKFRPITQTTRFKTVLTSNELTGEEIPKSLLETLNYKAGRNSAGRISIRRKGGRHKRKYRVIDFKRNKKGIVGVVSSIQYDPNRTCNIALIKYKDGEKRFILAPEGLTTGMEVQAGEGSAIRTGNALQLKHIPVGTTIHNIELQPGRGGQIARSAGGYATIAGRDKEYIILKIPSGELRKVHENCMATIGTVGNRDHLLVSFGKAGRMRWKGKRPHVRGVVMNPVDHPHGGGEGKTSGGRHPVTPWGQPTRGYKTRKKNKKSNAFIIQRRVNKRIGR